jgi:DNA-binding NarL/FixJ family response regulator
MENVEVFVVSPKALFRRRMESALSCAEEMQVWGASEVNDEVLSTLDILPPDVALVDIDSPDNDGQIAARQIKLRLPNTGVIMLTTNPGDAELLQALKCQAAAYLDKQLSNDELLSVVRRVARGAYPINDSLATRPQVAEDVLHQFQNLSLRNEEENLVSPLTPREKKILEYVAEGYFNKEIAVRLGISEQTVKNHVTSILRKLNANSRTEAVVQAIKQSLITVG